MCRPIMCKLSLSPGMVIATAMGATRDATVPVGTAPVGNLFCPAMQEWS
jgi:hypothetical protein